MAAAASALVAFWPATVASQATADSLPASASSFPSAHGAAGISQAQISEGNFALRQREVAVLVARQAAARQAAAQQQAQQQQAQQQAPQPAPSQAASAPSGSPQQIAMGMLGSYGWSSGQFSCLDSLWNEESGWNVFASNPTSGAYGIPQALPGSKMASAGPDWQSDAATQIRWGLGYIQSTYGSPCGAWAHEEADGWY
jgi:hypothetical protein